MAQLDRPGVPQNPAQRLALERQLAHIAREKDRPPPPAPPRRPRLILRSGTLDGTLLALGIGAEQVYGPPPFDDVYDADREEASRERLYEQEEAARRSQHGRPPA